MRIPIALLAGLTAAACGAATGGAPATAPETDPAPETRPAPDGRSAAEIEALYRARQDSARMRFTEADVRFMTGMIAHHAQALVMSGMAPTSGAMPSIRTLAARIINAQKDEIATMQRWLRDRGQPAPAVHIDGTELRVDGPEWAMNMPGILSPEQMEELERARGPEFDRLFLTYMIEHHQGAVTMVEALFATDGAARDEAAFRLASDIQVDQRTEIARMERMLSELPGER